MDKALKQRLVGASVLVILAVIVLPMLLSGRSDTLKQESREIELPPKPEELSIETRRFPVGVPNQPTPPADDANAGPVETPDTEVASAVTQAAKNPGQQEADEPVASGPPVSEEPAQEAPPPVVKSITLSSQRPEDVNVAETQAPAQDAPRYLVQVASFSSEKNANALASQLRAQNLNVLMDVVDRTAGRLHRVRVGPYAERSEADTVVASVRADIKDVNPRVLDLRPGESAPVSTPSDPLVRWVVQVGNFAESARAESLVAKLRLEGMTAFSEAVTTGNKTTYKVQVGPELDRARASELARKIKAEYPDAFVTTQE